MMNFLGTLLSWDQETTKCTDTYTLNSAVQARFYALLNRPLHCVLSIDDNFYSMEYIRQDQLLQR
jgi:hypothetical protein